MLNDSEIRKALAVQDLNIVPFDSELLQPVSYDLTLSEEVLVPRKDVHTIDPRMEARADTEYFGRVPSWHPHTTERVIPETGLTIWPRKFLLGCTVEKISLSPSMAARVEGKSSLGRLGIAVHITAGFIDPGFEGQITLEIVNLAPWSFKLYPGMPIAQIVFEPVNPPERDYSKTGRYQGQTGPTESRYREREGRYLSRP